VFARTARTSAGLVCLLAVLSAGGAVGHPPSPRTELASSSTSAQATGRALAAVVLDHLDRHSISKIEGETGRNGAFLILTMSHGPAPSLYATTIAPRFSHGQVRSCARARKDVAKQFTVTWCRATATTLDELVVSKPGYRSQVVGYHWATSLGGASVSMDQVTRQPRAARLIRGIVEDPRFGYFTTPATIKAGDQIKDYQEVHVTTTITTRRDTSPQPG
jgi:hypothetical protein